MKSYTDLEQSRKLAEILPFESADACWTNHMFGSLLSSWRIESTPPQEYKFLLDRFVVKGYLIESAWSLSALLEILKKIANKIDDDGSVDLSSFMWQWSVNMFDCPVEATDNYDNPVDACVAIIEKLHELNLL